MTDGGMNEWLADFYGTGADEGELEKAAEAALLEKLAEDGDIDIDELDDDEVVELAGALGLLGEDGGDYYEDEDEAKFAEADFLGRVMAHSQVDEMDKIAKGGWGARLGEFGGALPGAKRLGRWATKRGKGGVMDPHRAKVRELKAKLRSLDKLKVTPKRTTQMANLQARIAKMTAAGAKGGKKTLAAGKAGAKSRARAMRMYGGGAIGAGALGAGAAGYGLSKAAQVEDLQDAYIEELEDLVDELLY